MSLAVFLIFIKILWLIRNILDKVIKFTTLDISVFWVNLSPYCCDMDQSDTNSKKELIHLSDLSTRATNWKNDIHKFL